MRVKVTVEENLPVAYIDGKKVDVFEIEEYLYEAKDIEVQSDIEKFYAYETREYFLVQTPEIRDARLKAASANFWKFEIDGQNPKFGIINEVSLVESSLFGMYVSSEITPEEYDMILSGYDPDSYAAQEFIRIYKCIKNPALIRQAVSLFEIARAAIQSVVDCHEKEIIDYVCMSIHMMRRTNEDAFAFLHRAEESYGFDCGWVHFFFKDEYWRSMAKTASLDDDRVFADGRFSINFPYSTQSTTIKLMQAEKIVELVKKNCEIELKYSSQLD